MRTHPKTKIRKCGVIGLRKTDLGILDLPSRTRVLLQKVCIACGTTHYAEPSQNENKEMWVYRIKKKRSYVFNSLWHTHACFFEQLASNPAQPIMRTHFKTRLAKCEIIGLRTKQLGFFRVAVTRAPISVNWLLAFGMQQYVGQWQTKHETMSGFPGRTETTLKMYSMFFRNICFSNRICRIWLAPVIKNCVFWMDPLAISLVWAWICANLENLKCGAHLGHLNKWRLFNLMLGLIECGMNQQSLRYVL